MIARFFKIYWPHNIRTNGHIFVNMLLPRSITQYKAVEANIRLKNTIAVKMRIIIIVL